MAFYEYNKDFEIEKIRHSSPIMASTKLVTKKAPVKQELSINFRLK